MILRELLSSEVSCVSGGTSALDYRSLPGHYPLDGATPDGMSHPLNTGNPAVNFVNAMFMLSTGELTTDDLRVLTPTMIDTLWGSYIQGLAANGSGEIYNILGQALAAEGFTVTGVTTSVEVTSSTSTGSITVCLDTWFGCIPLN